MHLETMEIEKIPLSNNASALVTSGDGGGDKLVQVSNNRIMECRAFGHARII